MTSAPVTSPHDLLNHAERNVGRALARERFARVPVLRSDRNNSPAPLPTFREVGRKTAAAHENAEPIVIERPIDGAIGEQEILRIGSAFEGKPKRLPHRAMRAVGADHICGCDPDGLSPAPLTITWSAFCSRPVTVTPYWTLTPCSARSSARMASVSDCGIISGKA